MDYDTLLQQSTQVPTILPGILMTQQSISSRSLQLGNKGAVGAISWGPARSQPFSPFFHQIISDAGGRGSPFRELLNITHAYHVGARGWGGGDSVPSKRIFETVLTVLKYS